MPKTLKEIREASGLSQQDIANEIGGLTQGAVSVIEKADNPDFRAEWIAAVRRARAKKAEGLL